MSKNYGLRFISLMVFVLTILSLSVVKAQDSLDEQPLLKMLANVPDNATSRSEIYFNDRKAVEAAYPPAKMPSDWAEFSQLQGDADLSPKLMAVDLWWKVWRNQQSSRISQYMGVSDEMPQAVGFDFFAVAQEMNYGQPPLQSLQLHGSFDLNKVRLALAAHGLAQQDQLGVEVWCGSDGCDSGLKLSVRDRNPANPFGGDLGRKWPIIVQGNTLIGSPDLGVIQNHVAVRNGSNKSLGDAPEYRAAVEALTQNGVLMQAYFWDGEVLAGMSHLDPVLIAAKPELRKKIIAAMLKDYEPLPVYKLLAFGDVATNNEQVGQVAMVYANEADAKKAADILPKRIAAYMSLATNRPFKDLLVERGVSEPSISVVASNGQYVVLIAFATPKTTIEQFGAMSLADGNASGVTAPGLVYRLLVDSAVRRDIGWLNTVSREVLEAAGK